MNAHAVSLELTSAHTAKEPEFVEEFLSISALRLDTPHGRGCAQCHELTERLRMLAKEDKTRWPSGNAICARERYVHVKNSCFLDFLVAHPEVIPKECNEKVIFFSGKCKFSGCKPCMRYLHREGDRWEWKYWQGEGIAAP